MRHIFINGIRLINKIKQGKTVLYILEDGQKINRKNIIKVETECKICKQKRTIKRLHYYNLKKETTCCKCNAIGEKNPFYGKKHTKESRNKISIKNTGKPSSFKGKKHTEENKRLISIRFKGRFIGKNNPFYGKKHSLETIAIIVQKNKERRDALTEEQKKILSKKYSECQKKLKEQNPEKYIANKRKAGLISLKSKIRYKKNKIEKMVENELLKRNMIFEYSIIMDYKQYDFGHKDKKILLEVQGDYWHGNPNLYKKENLNDVQIKNINKDIEKNSFAKKHNFYLYYIWEQDILNNNFIVLDNIKEEHFNEI